jgi:HPt (histidine-containing phosphotransfer) domain-containing protein
MRSEAKYKWDNPADWLDDRVTKAVDENDVPELVSIIHSLKGQLDFDGIQEAFQSDMEADGYFKRNWEGTDAKITNLSRALVVELLEGISIECRDDETLSTLQDALNEGDIDEGDLYARETPNYHDDEALPG